MCGVCLGCSGRGGCHDWQCISVRGEGTPHPGGGGGDWQRQDNTGALWAAGCVCDGGDGGDVELTWRVYGGVGCVCSTVGAGEAGLTSSNLP